MKVAASWLYAKTGAGGSSLQTLGNQRRQRHAESRTYTLVQRHHRQHFTCVATGRVSALCFQTPRSVVQGAAASCSVSIELSSSWHQALSTVSPTTGRNRKLIRFLNFRGRQMPPLLGWLAGRLAKVRPAHPGPAQPLSPGCIRRQRITARGRRGDFSPAKV